MNEIEEFLKRAAALRAQQAGQRGGQPARPAAPSPSPTPAPPARPLSPFGSRAEIVSAEIVDAEVIEAEEPSHVSVAEHVQQHLGRRDTTAPPGSTQPFAASVRQADDVIEAHLHETFEHRLGALGARTSRAEDSTLDDEEAAAKAAAAARPSPWSILRMLRSPQEMRNAIILSEVLNPPTQRW